MLVCARCAGIYFGGLIAGLSSLFIALPSTTRRVLFFALIPLIMDVSLTFTGVYSYSQFVAFATGLTFGSVLYLLGISELENLFSTKRYKMNE